MTQELTTIAVQMLIFAFIGLGVEVFFTALWTLKDPRKHLIGYSSIWYMPLYALAPLILMFARAHLFQLPFALRGVLYVLAFFTIEYLGMGFLRLLLGSSPSQESYYKSPWNVHGLIRLDFAPAIFLLGTLFELIFRFLN